MKKPLAYVEPNAFQIVTESTPSDPYQLPSGTRIGDAEISASGLTAPRTYTFQDKSGAVLLADRLFLGEDTEAIYVPEDFATVEEAIRYLSGCIFAAGTSASVIINNSVDFNISGYDLPNVSIYSLAAGNTSLSTAVSVASITGSSGNYSVTLNLNSASLFNVGDVLYFPGDYLVGTGVFQALAGICKVTATSASTITCQYKYYKASPFPTLTLTSARIERYTTSNPIQSVYIYNCVLGGIGLRANSINILNSQINDITLHSADNQVAGSSIKNSSINSLSLYSGGSAYAFDIKQSHISQLKGAWSCNSAGLTISLDSTVILDAVSPNSFCVMGNNAIGMLVEDSKVLWEGSAGCPISAKHNLTYDVRATGCGYVRATGILNSPVLNPVANTIGNGNALIRTL
jgi:hypothetical protein